MFTYSLNRKTNGGSQKLKTNRGLRVESLETRAMMSAVPADALPPDANLMDAVATERADVTTLAAGNAVIWLKVDRVLKIYASAGMDTYCMSGVRESNGNLVFWGPGTSLGTVVGKCSEFDRIEYHGYSGNDIFSNATSIPASIWGGAGNDTLSGGKAGGMINGGTGNDKITAAGPTTIIGGDGDDTITARGAACTIDCGSGNDQVTVAGGRNKVLGGAGNDIIKATEDDNILLGQDGNDKIAASGRSNILVGGAGDDELGGGVGNDILIGGAGVDTLMDGKGDNIFIGGSTAIDNNLAALESLMAAWNSSSSSKLADRAAIAQKSLIKITDDAKFDLMLTGAGQDLLFGRSNDTIYPGVPNPSGVPDDLFIRV